MRKKIYLSLTIISAIMFIISLYFGLFGMKKNSKDYKKNEKTLQNQTTEDKKGLIDKVSDKVKEKHCIDNICVKIHNLGKNNAVGEVMFLITNNSNDYIEGNFIKITSEELHQMTLYFYYNSLKPNETTSVLSQYKPDIDLLKLKDYKVEFLTQNEIDNLTNNKMY